MHDLNSVLIEGEVKTVYTRENMARNLVGICNNQGSCHEGADHDLALFPVDISLLSLPVRQLVTKGRALRVVGRLDSRSSYGLVIVAEHLELRPK